MKKKIGDLTFDETFNICKKHKKCKCCPLCYTVGLLDMCLKNIKLIIDEKEIEVEDE